MILFGAYLPRVDKLNITWLKQLEVKSKRGSIDQDMQRGSSTKLGR